jgi:hypothetical protein
MEGNMKIGYMAVGNHGTTYHLTEANKHPRGQLLAKCYRKHAAKMFVDSERGDTAKHIGYIIGGEWFTVYEVHEWQG